MNNIYRYSTNKTSIQYTSAIYSNDGFLQFLSATPNDAFLFSTTSTSNVYSYNVQTRVATRIASNLAATAHTPCYDAYTNNLYCSLSSANSIIRIPLDGTGAVAFTLTSGLVSGFTGSNPQTLTLSKSYLNNLNLYVMLNTGTDSRFFAISFTSYPSTTYTFSNLLDNTYTESNYTNGITGSLDGPIATATFNEPYTMAINPINGNLYISDFSNYTLRMITPTGTVSTIAGTVGSQGHVDGNGTAAQFYSILSIAVNSTGTTLYCATSFDQDNYIRIVDLTTGMYSVTSSTNQYTNVQSICIDPTNTYLYAATWYNAVILRITISNWASNVLAGAHGVNAVVDGIGSSARFSDPLSICIDSVGSNLYLTDYNYNIRMVTIATSNVVTIVGNKNGTGGTWNGDGNGTSVTISSTGPITINSTNTALYFRDEKSIRMVELVSGNYTVTTISGFYGAPYGQSNNVYQACLFWHPSKNVLYYYHPTAKAIKIINSNSRPNSNVQIKNLSGVPITIAGTGNTVVQNSNISSSLSATEVSLLQNTNGNVYTIY
jgi:hypothetical protein